MNDGTQISSGSVVPLELILRVFPGISMPTAKSLQRVSLLYPKDEVFVYHGTRKGINNSAVYQVLSGSVEIGYINELPNNETEFVPVHTVKVGTTSKEKIYGLYIPQEYLTNDFELRAGEDDTIITRISYELVDSLCRDVPQHRQKFENMQRELLMRMLMNGHGDEATPSHKLKMLGHSIGRLILDMQDADDKDVEMFVEGMSLIAGSLYAKRHGIQQKNPRSLGIQRLISMQVLHRRKRNKH